MEIKNRNIINYAFLTIVVLLIVYILGFLNFAYEKEKNWWLDYKNLEKARELMYNGDYITSGPLITQLMAKGEYANSIPIIWNFAIYQAGLGNNEKAEELFNRVRQLRPLVVREYDFLVQYGQVELNLEKYNEAKKYFLASKTIEQKEANNVKTIEFVNKKIEEIENKLK